MESGKKIPVRQNKSDRGKVIWPGIRTASGLGTSSSVVTGTGARREPARDVRNPGLSEALEHLLPRFRAITGLLATDGKPQDAHIHRFVQSLMIPVVTDKGVSLGELEARFFDFLDAEQKNHLHAIYLPSGAEMNLIGQTTLRELSKILEVISEIHSSDTGQ